jgi:hypothetical protein
MSLTVLVVGATGSIGRLAVDESLRQGRQTRARGIVADNGPDEQEGLRVAKQRRGTSRRHGPNLVGACTGLPGSGATGQARLVVGAW